MVKHIDDAAGNERGITRESLYRTLLGDIVAAFDWLDADGSQTSKRYLIRTMFAGIEGSLWSFKEHIRSIALEIERLTPLQDFALSGRDYFITDAGHIRERTRFITMLTLVKTMTRLAEEFCPGFKADYDHQGWTNLKLAIIIRNKITHPKHPQDLEISDDDILICRSALFWVLELGTQLMEAANIAFAKDVHELKSILQDIKDGDERTLAAAQQIKTSFKN